MGRWKYTLGFLLLVAVLVGLALVSFPDKKLHLIACDVGQGDAILAVYGSTQILFDGGPDSRVLSCLSRHMPFWDREIELVSLSHPQADHYQGLIAVFRNYKVDSFLATPLNSGSQGYELLKKEVGSSSTSVINPTAGMVIRFDSIYLDIVHPSNEYLAFNGRYQEAVPSGSGVLGAYTSSLDPNNFSIVAILRFRDFDALLTGDMGPEITNGVLSTAKIKDVEYIKVPHHGSKNGLTKELLDASTPEIAVISVGKNNSYGHPHQEVIKLLREKAIKTFRTDEEGDVEVVTDGKNMKVY